MAVDSNRRRTHRTVAIGLLLLITSWNAESQEWTPRPAQMPTRWTAAVGPNSALPEYPRPQMTRPQWTNLNGLWRYALTARDAGMPSQWDGQILVPFPIESALSGVQKVPGPDQSIWYSRNVDINVPQGQRVLLHFGAVDNQSVVFLNGREIGSHNGGYAAFSLDITSAARSGPNQLVVRVHDSTWRGPYSYGKQGSAFTPSSGIWQTVWLETVPNTYIRALRLRPDIDQAALRLDVDVAGEQRSDSLEATVLAAGKILARKKFRRSSDIHIPNPRLWSPNEPFLYDLQIRLYDGERLIDEVASYFGMRKVEIKRDAAGHKRVYLNNRSIFSLGVLDQGYWPEGLLTAPTDEALKFDVEVAKAMGFNVIRKHVKIEPQRWYYHCDKLGMLVWQDMVPPANGTAEARQAFEGEVQEILAQLDNHPSIVAWVLFNERWGAYDQERIAVSIRKTDSSRLMDAHSGPNANGWRWLVRANPSIVSRYFVDGDYSPISDGLKKGVFEAKADWRGSDFVDTHQYPHPVLPVARDKVRILGEFGGIGSYVEGHIWKPLEPGHSNLALQPEQVSAAYADMMAQVIRLEPMGLSGAIYTQLYDVEQGQSGLMTYDRSVTRIPVTDLARIHTALVPAHGSPAAMDAALLRGEAISGLQAYQARLARYRSGERDPAFLRALTVMALQRKDQAHATEVGNEAIARAAKPYTQDNWVFLLAVTRSSRDEGFALLQAERAGVDALFGAGTADKKISEIILHEEVRPHLDETWMRRAGARDWEVLVKELGGKYGALGEEVVYGAAMIEAARRESWPEFARFFKLHFRTDARRSPYWIPNIAHAVLAHVSDPSALNMALAALAPMVSADRLPVPQIIDVYAGLHYKLGRTDEALKLQERAELLNGGQDEEIADHAIKMRGRQRIE